MSEAVQVLERAALKLSAEERAGLARVLLLSLDAPSEEEVQQLWAREAERRWLEIRDGKVEAIPSEEVFRDLRSMLR